MTRLALIPSPFVGAVSWHAVAEILPNANAVDYGAVTGPDWFADAASRVAAQMDNGPWIAVLHSGAGAFAPALADASTNLAGFIFVDAGLPMRGRSSLEGAGPEFTARLRARTTDGVLAPWNSWFDADPTERMIPDAVVSATFIAAQPRVPFAFLEAPCAGSEAWEALPSAYLQLSRVYEDAAREAEARDWPVQRLRAHHLAIVSDPERVARSLETLAIQLVR